LSLPELQVTATETDLAELMPKELATAAREIPRLNWMLLVAEPVRLMLQERPVVSMLHRAISRDRSTTFFTLDTLTTFRCVITPNQFGAGELVAREGASESPEACAGATPARATAATVTAVIAAITIRTCFSRDIITRFDSTSTLARTTNQGDDRTARDSAESSSSVSVRCACVSEVIPSAYGARGHCLGAQR
jgi:hypothetical protein